MVITSFFHWYKVAQIQYILYEVATSLKMEKHVVALFAYEEYLSKNPCSTITLFRHPILSALRQFV